MAQQSDRNNESQTDGQGFTLRSEFARRGSSRPDGGVTRQTSISVPMQARISTESGEEADITETLRVIDSARRYMNHNTNSSKDNEADEALMQTQTILTASEKEKSHRIFMRDMSKETLKKTGSSLDVLEEADKEVENVNDVTQEAFKDEMADITAGLKSNQSQLISFLKDEEQSIELVEARLGRRHVSAVEISQRRKKTLIVKQRTNHAAKDVVVEDEDYEVTSADQLDAHERDRRAGYHQNHGPTQSLAQAAQMSNGKQLQRGGTI